MASIFIPKCDSDNISDDKIKQVGEFSPVEIIIDNNGMTISALDITDCDRVINNIFELDSLDYEYVS